MASGLNSTYVDNYKQTGGELILGSGRFVGPRTLEVALPGEVRLLCGTNVIVSTGTRAALEPIPALAVAQPLTPIEALELDQIPEHLIVIGGATVLIGVLIKMGLLKNELDYHFIRASMVLIFLFFGYQKWFYYEAKVLIPYISNGPLISWMYRVFGIRGACMF